MVVVVWTVQPRALAADQPTPSGPEIDFRVGAIHSDNVELTPSSRTAGEIWLAGMDVDLVRHGSRLNLDAHGNLDWEDYPSGTFGSGMLGSMDALATLDIVSKALTWSAEETFGQLLVNPLAAATPDNLKNVYYFTTGPDVTFHPSGGTSIRLGARYSNTDSALQALNGNRYRGEAAFIHELSGVSSISLQANVERFRFTDPAVSPVADFDHGEAYANYELHGARTDARVDAGYTVLKQTGRSTTGGPLGRLTLGRRLTASSQLQLIADTQFSDASDALRDGLVQAGVTQLAAVLGTEDAFKTNSAALRWDFTRGRNSLEFEIERSEEKHQTFIAFNRKTTTWSVNASRRLRPHLSLSAMLSRAQETYQTGFDDRILQGNVTLDWLVGRKLDLLLRYERRDRTANAESSDFTENRVGLYAQWSPLGRR